MISRYEAYMDGEALSAVDSSIYVLDIQYGSPSYAIQTSKVSGRPGARVVKKESESTPVTILFEIHEYDTAKRQAVCQKVQKWANGKILAVSDRPNQQLRAVCQNFPVINAKAWTEPVSMTFIGFNPPYWEEKNQTLVKITGASGNKKAFVPGNAGKALVELTVKANASASGFTAAVAGHQLTVLVQMATNDTVTISYDENMIQSIKKGNTSILDKRTGADDLLAVSGETNTFEISSDASVTATFAVRGCWR